MSTSLIYAFLMEHNGDFKTNSNNKYWGIFEYIEVGIINLPSVLNICIWLCLIYINHNLLGMYLALNKQIKCTFYQSGTGNKVMVFQSYLQKCRDN